MTRRELLNLFPGAGISLYLSGFPVKSVASAALQSLISLSTNNKILVFIQLSGGNDGLNTIIPVSQYNKLSVARSNILIPETRLLAIDGQSSTMFHPSLKGIRNMYNNGLVNIVQGVSYPNPSFSHFRATDILFTGSGAENVENTGILGRMLAHQYPNYPTGYPSEQFPDPPALEIGTSISTCLLGPKFNMGNAISDPDDFYHINQTISPSSISGPAGNELNFIRSMAFQTDKYAERITAASRKGKNRSSLYPSGNSLAEQLKIVSRLISGGLTTKVYVVTLGGFDTHSTQTDPTDRTKGNHAALLEHLSSAIEAFFDDCKLNATRKFVAAATFSEFGRRIGSNGSGGTDHGSAYPVMFFGDCVIPGIVGVEPMIPDTPTINDNLEMQFDYRQLFASIITDFFEIDTPTTGKILANSYEVLPIFKTDITKKRPLPTLQQNYPNPFHSSTNIAFTSTGGDIVINLYDTHGKYIKVLTEGVFTAGDYLLVMNRDGIPDGTYVIKMVSGSYATSIKIQAV